MVVVALGYGVGAGLLLPRAVYRLSVEPDEPWRSGCPAGHPLTGPAAAWLGRSHCPLCPTGPTGPARYGPPPAGPAVLSALVCGALAAAAGGTAESLVWALLAPVVVLLALVDRAVHRLPDVLTLPLALAVTALLGVAALTGRAGGDWPRAVLGGLALGAGYLVLFLINPDGMGFGDVKLALPLGVALGWYGWGVWLVGVFLGFLYGTLYGLALAVRGRGGRRTALAFGPFMAAGAFTGVLLGGLGA
ncbi:prepilin peptidase [Streptomyces sp. NPDC002073]